MDPVLIGMAALSVAAGAAIYDVATAYTKAKKGMRVVVRFDKDLATKEPLTDDQARSIVEEVLRREPLPSGR